MSNHNPGFPPPYQGGPAAPQDGSRPDPGFAYPVPPGHQPGYPPYPGPPAPQPRRWIWPVVAGVVAVLAVAGWASAGALALAEDPPVPEHPSVARDADREAARVAACEFTTAMSTYDHTDLASYKTSVIPLTTGEFHDDFESSWSALEGAMAQSQVSSRMSDLDCAYLSGEGDRITVLAVFRQIRSNFAEPEPTAVPMITYNTMVRTDGRWLVEQLDSPFVK